MAKVWTLLDQAASILNDPRGQNWPRGELLSYFNAGVRAMVALAPSQFPVTKTLTLVLGPRQELPYDEDDGFSVVLIDVHRVIEADDSYGRVVRKVSKSALDASSPRWATADPAEVREVAYDPKIPKEFWVSPPAVAGSKLQVTTADEPAYLQVFSDVPVDTRYHSALVDYVLYRAFSKDADYAGQDQRASQHFKAFVEGVSGRSSAG